MMDEAEAKIDYKKKIIYISAKKEQFVPKYLYYLLEYIIKTPKDMDEKEFFQFKVVLDDCKTTVENLRQGGW